MSVVTEMLEDWDPYCDDPDSGIRATEFTYFFAEQPDESELQQFLARFQSDKQQQLLDRVLDYLADRKVPAPAVSDDELIDVARSHVAELRRQAELIGSPKLVGEFGTDKEHRIVESDDIDRRLSSPDSELMELLGEEIDSNTPTDRQTWGLLEACYGVESNFYIQWYLAKPIIDLDLDLSPYYELWRIGGDCLVTDEYVAVARDGR